MYWEFAKWLHIDSSRHRSRLTSELAKTGGKLERKHFAIPAWDWTGKINIIGDFSFGRNFIYLLGYSCTHIMRKSRGLYSINGDDIRGCTQDTPLRLRRQISLVTNAIQIQTNSPCAEEAVYQEICPSLLRPAKFVFPFLPLACSGTRERTW